MSLNCQMPKHADVWHVRDRVVPCTLMRQARVGAHVKEHSRDSSRIELGGYRPQERAFRSAYNESWCALRSTGHPNDGE